MTVIAWVWFVLVVSVVSLVALRMFEHQVLSTDAGTPAMRPNAAPIRRAGNGERMKTNFLSSRWGRFASLLTTLILLGQGAAFAQPATQVGGEANLQLPDLTQVQFLGMNGHQLLLWGPAFCILGMIFGLVIYFHLKKMPAHKSMLEVSELIWETCKTYLIHQGKFLLLLWSFIAVVILAYFAVLLHFSALKVIIILGFSILGMAGSYFVAWFGIRVNTLANSRAAYASLGGNPYRAFGVPLKSGMSIGMMLISIELLLMFSIILFVPGSYAGPCFIGFAIGESLGAAVLRLAGGIFTKIADIGADLMKIVFHVKEDDARNPGVIADCTGDNAGDSVGPTADGFETYGVVQVALIAFLILGAKSATVGVQVLVWLFAVRVAMLVAAVAGYYINEVISKARFGKALEFNFEAPLTSLVVDHFHRDDCRHLPSHLSSASQLRWRSYALVETGDHHLLRNHRRGLDTGTGEGVHLDRSSPRKRSGGVGTRGWSCPGSAVRVCLWKLFRLLPGTGGNNSNVDWLRGKHSGLPECGSGGADVRLWPGGVRLPRNGTCHDRSRLIWAGDR